MANHVQYQSFQVTGKCVFAAVVCFKCFCQLVMSLPGKKRFSLDKILTLSFINIFAILIRKSSEIIDFLKQLFCRTKILLILVTFG